MQIIDLSHEIHAEMTIFGGTEKPEIHRKNSIQKDGFNLHEIHINSHTGTHVDAPAHMVLGTKYLDDFPLSHFYGSGLMLQVNRFAGKEIPLSFFKNYEEQIQEVDFLLLNSSWHKLWESPDYHQNYPVLSLESAKWLTHFKLKGIGFDYISIDPVESQEVPLHKIILGAEILIIENLNNLDSLPEEGFYFQCLPLKINKADGSTARIVAFVE